MSELVPISWPALIGSLLLLIIPLALSAWLRVPLLHPILVSSARMAGQLFLVGIILVYLFQWDDPLLNLAWVMGMLGFAAFSTLQSSQLNPRPLILPVFAAFTIAGLGMLLLFNAFILDLDRILEARYLLVIGGLLIGNAMKGNVIGISRFYHDLQQHQEVYQQRIGLGAIPFEARKPFFREAFQAALQPQIASMATMGVVFLPGLMTGQIISGVSPVAAIKYQIAIVIAIFASMAGSVALAMLFSMAKGFDRFGRLREGVFRDGRKGY
jgi:putative ABC transport system permease protein